MAMEEEAPRRRVAHEIGQDLTSLSVDELRARIELLKFEIDRMEQSISSKTSSRAAADSFFKFS